MPRTYTVSVISGRNSDYPCPRGRHNWVVTEYLGDNSTAVYEQCSRCDSTRSRTSTPPEREFAVRLARMDAEWKQIQQSQKIRIDRRKSRKGRRP